MTNEELLQDLKQFISATVRAEVSSAVEQSEERLRGEITTAVSESEKRLRDEIFQAQKQTGELAAQAVEDLGNLIETDKAETKRRLDQHDQRLDDHGHRIQRLEHHPA